MSARQKEPEYTLNIFRRVDERTGEDAVVLFVQTTKVFISFQYEILLDARREGPTVYLDILGLHAPTDLMPGTGPAQGYREVTGLPRTFRVVVQQQDKTPHVYECELDQGRVTIVHTPEQGAILASSDIVDIP